MSNAVPDGSTCRTPTCPGPFQSRPMFCRMNDTPMAVISGASFGASRSGR